MAMGAVALGTGAIEGKDRGHFGRGAVLDEQAVQQRHQRLKTDER
ncbi:hypothetical protein [Pseudomonas poae]